MSCRCTKFMAECIDVTAFMWSYEGVYKWHSFSIITPGIVMRRSSNTAPGLNRSAVVVKHLHCVCVCLYFSLWLYTGCTVSNRDVVRLIWSLVYCIFILPWRTYMQAWQKTVFCEKLSNLLINKSSYPIELKEGNKKRKKYLFYSGLHSELKLHVMRDH